MPHKPSKRLSFWPTCLALAIVTLFTWAADSNAQETLQPYAPPILHTFLDSANVYPEIRERIVTTIPLEFIWTDEEQLKASRKRYLSPTDLTEMLKIQQVEFMVAEVGAPLKRISVDRCYEFGRAR